ncbi:MAG: hypothetical protein HY321_16205 [Armatimonadetes bacterium]|nr:hypothetical protein [Armatimonadota bacterium]
MGRTLVPAAKAAPSARKSVVIFEVENKGQGGEGLARALTRQVQLVFDEKTSGFDLVHYTWQEPYSPPIERAVKRDNVLPAQDLTPRPELPVALKIAQVLGADLFLMAGIDEDGYQYDAAAKRVTLTVTASLYSAATGDMVKSVSVTAIGSGDSMQGVLEDRARVEVARALEARLAGKSAASNGAPEKPIKHGVRRWVLIGAAAAALAVLAVSLFGGDDDGGPASPGGVSLTATREGVLVSWQASTEPGVTSYRIYRATVTDTRARVGDYQLIAEVPAGGLTSYEDKTAPVDPNVQYSYRVAAVAGGDEGAPVTSARAAAPGKPDIVTGLTAQVVDARSIQLSWAANREDFISGYRVYRSTEAATGYTKVGSDLPASQRTYVDSGSLAGGQTYFYKVTAVGVHNQESDLALSQPVSKSTDFRPSPPRNVSAATTEGKREIVVRWESSSEPDVQYYRVYRSFTRHRSGVPAAPVGLWGKNGPRGGSRAGSWQLRFDRVPLSGAATVSVVDGEVDYNTTYQYAVTAVSPQGESDQSAAASASPNQRPGMVQGLRAEAGDGKVVLRWSPLVEPDIQGYVVYRQTADQSTKTRLTEQPLPASQLQYEDKAVVNGTAYYYFVSATDTLDLAGEGALSAAYGPVRPTAPPATPTGVRVAAGTGVVSLQWNRNPETNILGYRVLRSDAPGAAPRYDVTVPDAQNPYFVGAGSVDATVITFRDPNVQDGVTYYYQVVAVNTSGVVSAPGAVFNATPSVPPAKPENVQAVAGDISVTVTWNPVTRLADGRSLASLGLTLRGYTVYRTNAASGARTLVQEIALVDLQGEARAVDSTAPVGIGFYYSITATMLDAGGGVVESQPGVQMDPNPVIVIPKLPAPAGFQGTGGDARVTLTWTPWTAAEQPVGLGYAIYGATTANGPYKALFPALDTGGNPRLALGKGQYALLPGESWLTPVNGATLWFKIATVDKAGVEGTQSPAISVTPNPPAQP